MNASTGGPDMNRAERGWGNALEVVGLSAMCCYLAYTGDTITGTCDRLLGHRYARYLVPAVLGAGLFHLLLEADR